MACSLWMTASRCGRRLTGFVTLAGAVLCVAATLPPTPDEMPKKRLSATSGGSIDKYSYDESTDPLTDVITRSLQIGLSAERVTEGVIEPTVHFHALALAHIEDPSGTATAAMAILRTTDEPLANLFVPQYLVIYRPVGEKATQKEATGKVEMASLGEYNESAWAPMSVEDLVHLVSSPLIRLKGDKGSQDYKLDETDKQAILWFVGRKIPGGDKVIGAYRSEIAAIE